MPSRRTALQIGEEFSKLQENRVQTYNNLNHAHKEYLASAPNYNFKKYQKEVAEATAIFKDISTKVISLRKEIDGSDLDTFIEKVRRFQFNIILPLSFKYLLYQSHKNISSSQKLILTMQSQMKKHFFQILYINNLRFFSISLKELHFILLKS